MAGVCGHDSLFLGSIRDGEFYDQLSDYQLLDKDSAQQSYV